MPEGEGIPIRAFGHQGAEQSQQQNLPPAQDRADQNDRTDVKKRERDCIAGREVCIRNQRDAGEAGRQAEGAAGQDSCHDTHRAYQYEPVPATWLAATRNYRAQDIGRYAGPIRKIVLC